MYISNEIISLLCSDTLKLIARDLNDSCYASPHERADAQRTYEAVAAEYHKETEQELPEFNPEDMETVA